MCRPVDWPGAITNRSTLTRSLSSTIVPCRFAWVGSAAGAIGQGAAAASASAAIRATNDPQEVSCLITLSRAQRCVVPRDPMRAPSILCGPRENALSGAWDAI